MPLKIKDIKVEGYERIIHAKNDTTKLDCLIAIHNTKLGPRFRRSYVRGNIVALKIKKEMRLDFQRLCLLNPIVFVA